MNDTDMTEKDDIKEQPSREEVRTSDASTEEITIPESSNDKRMDSIRKWAKKAGALLSRFWAWFKRNFRRYLSPAFAVMLLLSFIMWYMIKLGYSYVTEIPVTVDIEGHKFKVTCVVEGEGYNLFANRHYNRRSINLKWSDVEATSSTLNPGAVVITPYSLQNAISVRKPDIKIISMGAIPEIDL